MKTMNGTLWMAALALTTLGACGSKAQDKPPTTTVTTDAGAGADGAASGADAGARVVQRR